ncbi:MAG: PAS domain S-box protein, partial [Coleofasciculus sp. S288]|nr:PAS domain S-box protein [Coleofasciculus sp. S288]
MSTHRTVLVIADSDESDRDYGHQLQQDGSFVYKILTQRYDTQILELSRSQQVDGILLELDSPYSGSFDVLRQLKEQMGERCPPIVVIDSKDAEIAVQAFKNGAVDYLVKDRMTPDDLRLAMRSAIENAELRRELQRRQEQFQTSVENMLDCFGIFSSMRDESGQIVDFRIDYLNGAACENNRMPKQMQIGRGLCEVLPAHRESGLFNEYCRLVETGEPLIKDSLIYDDTYSGQRLIRAFDIRATKLNDGFVASWRDITDRKRLELELSQRATDLRQQQNRLQRLIDTAPIGIGIGSENGEVRVINDTMLRLHGLTREEFEQRGMNWRDFALPEDAERTEQVMAQLQQQGFLPPEEKELLRTDGTRIPIWISAMQWMDNTDEHVAFAVDLTQQKQAEEALQDSEERYRYLADNISQLAWMADEQGWIFWYNQRWFDYTGTTLEDMEGWGWQKVHHPEHVEGVVKKFRHCIETGETWEDTFLLRGKDGQYRWFLSRAIPIRDEQDRVLRWFGTNTDITDLRQTEIALQQTTERLNIALKSAPITLFNQDLDLRYTWIYNPTQNYSVEEVIGQRDEDLASPDTAARLTQLKQQVLNTSMGLREEVKVTKDGQTAYYDLTIDPIRDSQNAIIGITCAAVDISHRKQAEEALRESEERLNVAQLAAKIGTWDWDMAAGSVFWSKEYYTLYGLDPTIPSTYENWLATILEADRATADRAIREALQQRRTHLNFEFRISHPTQGIRWFASLSQIFYDSDGQPKRAIGISIDITDRKQVEAAIAVKEARLQGFVDANVVGILHGDIYGNIHEANDELLRIVGYTREDLRKGRLRWIDITPPEYLPLDEQAIAEARANGACTPYEKEYICKDGSRVPILIGYSLVGEAREESVAFILDLRDRKLAEEALRQSEDRLRMAIESAQLGTWDWNLITNKLTWDEGCKAMFGLPPEAETSLEVFLEGVHPDDRERLKQVVQESLNPASGGSYDVEYRTIGIQDGIERWIAAKGQVYFDAAGNPLRFIGTVLDITKQKQAEAEREQLLEQEQAAREAAERANRVKDEFLAILSHELRSPLNPILGWTKLLQTRQLNPTKVAEALATIERNAKLQTQLIDDLLDVTKILRGKLSLNTTSVNLSLVIEAAIDTVRTTAVAKSISLHPRLPNIGQVSGDAARLQQIVWNLLSNAIKFTPNHGQVNITLEQIGNQAEITVTDTGKGINPDFLPHIFESFRQEDGSISRKYGGLGLGLAIVRQLVEAHGGTIKADSPGEGLGATFTVRLPLLNVEPEIKQIERLPQQTLD